MRSTTATTKIARADGASAASLRFFDARALTPILMLPEDAAAGRLEIELSGGPWSKASVENLETGAKRDFEIAGAKTLVLDVSRGPLAVRIQPAEKPGGETRATVSVGAARSLTAEEIVARERVWDAGQREKVANFSCQMKASLRFRVAEVNETFDLTIQGPFFFERGHSPDWAWHEFFLNGVLWKGKMLPRIPILQADKVTTLPLDIELTEAYDYVLKSETRVGGRRAYHVSFTPEEQRRRQAHLSRQRLDRRRDVCAPPPRVGPAQPERRNPVERPDRVLPRRARAAGRLPSARDPRRAGLPDGRPHDGHRAGRPDDRRSSSTRPTSKRKRHEAYATAGPDGARYRQGPAVPRARPAETGRSDRGHEGQQEEPLRAARRLLRPVRRLSAAADRPAVLRLRSLPQGQAAVRLLCRRDPDRQLHGPVSLRHPLRSGRRSLRYGHSLRRRLVSQRTGSQVGDGQGSAGDRAGQHRASPGPVSQGVPRALLEVERLPARQRTPGPTS